MPPAERDAEPRAGVRRARSLPVSVTVPVSSLPERDVPPTVFLVGCNAGTLDMLALRRPDVTAIVLEPDPDVARRFLDSRDWSAWTAARRLTLLVGPEYTGAIGAWRPASVPRDEPPIVIDARLAGRADAIRPALSIAGRLIADARANAAARDAHAARYLLHTLSNTTRMAREGDAASLDAAFAGTPAIIVGAGPSLDGRLATIAEASQRALVIACDTAARPLMAAGVQPHLIVAVDPAESNAMHLAALHGPARSWLVAEGSLHPTAFAAFDRRTFFFNVSDHEPWPWLHAQGLGRGRLAAWGSVATSALDLALRMGCSPVLLAGLDFAFTGGRAYCRGTTFEAQWATWMGAGQSLEAITAMLLDRWPAAHETDARGHLVRTAPHLVSFRDWMRERIASATATRFVHVTDGGILHGPTIERTSVADALASHAALEQPAVQATLRALHRRRPDTTDALFAAIDELAAGVSAGRDPRAQWAAFAGRPLAPQTLLAALESHEFSAWRRGRASATRQP